MEAKLLQATTEDAGQRIDSFLASQLEGVSRSAAARLLESGCVSQLRICPGFCLRNAQSQLCDTQNMMIVMTGGVLLQQSLCKFKCMIYHFLHLLRYVTLFCAYVQYICPQDFIFCSL